MIKNLEKYNLIFWDFDGVIKDSVDVKTDAYLSLFANAPKEVYERIKSHQLEYGGISRLVKIPLYLEWVGIKPTKQAISENLEEFANLVVQKVISSPWVPGVEQTLKQKQNHQKFVIVTGTPQREIEDILVQLHLNSNFDLIFGAPTQKSKAIEWVLQNYNIKKEDSILIGDSKTDWLAADENEINFLYRDKGDDSQFSRKFDGMRIQNFL